ncbi:hypothetical protein [Vibrio campbellii]|uniref:hypothetical protein n=1 Tax=Vibrio campbellii TaxID=680 RepID=UPI001E2C7361|nr:hypothetical protein [Vibrio campbellii]
MGHGRDIRDGFRNGNDQLDIGVQRFNDSTIQSQMKNHSVKPKANLSDTLNLILAVTMVASGFILYNFASVAGLQNFVR